MNITKRIEQIESQITSMSKPMYHKREVLPGLLDIQKEMVQLTFDADYADNMNLKIYDVVQHLENKNNELNHIADESLERFKSECKDFGNMIAREIAGSKGERLAKRTLEVLQSNRRMLFNVELKEGDIRTELDAVVFTSKAIFMIEVKNPSKDMVIDAKGNYYKAHGYMDFGRNLGEKVNDKSHLLRESLKEIGKPLNIVEIVVFSNNQIKVENRSKYIKHCFLSQLPHIIDEYNGKDIYADEDMDFMEGLVHSAECEEEYPIEFDIVAFKRDFATVVAALESAAEINRIKAEQTKETPKVNMWTKIRDSIKKDPWTYVGGIASILGGAAVAVAVTKNRN